VRGLVAGEFLGFGQVGHGTTFVAGAKGGQRVNGWYGEGAGQLSGVAVCVNLMAAARRVPPPQP